MKESSLRGLYRRDCGDRDRGVLVGMDLLRYGVCVLVMMMGEV